MKYILILQQWGAKVESGVVAVPNNTTTWEAEQGQTWDPISKKNLKIKIAILI
jgi:hypothetical protein